MIATNIKIPGDFSHQNRFPAKGHRPIIPTIDYKGLTAFIPEAYTTLQSAFDALVVGETYESISGLSGTMSTSIGSEIVSGASTSFSSEVETDDTITIDGESMLVRDVTSDTELRLWAGAHKTSVAKTGQIKKPTNITLVTSSADNTLSGTVPDGVSLQVIGSDILNKWTAVTAPLVADDYANIEVHNFTQVAASGVVALVRTKNWGIGGTARGIFRASQINCLSDGYYGFYLIQGSACIVSNITARKIKANFIADYVSINNVSTHNQEDDDVMLMAIPATRVATDIAYPHTVNNFSIYKRDASLGNFNGGLEWNQWANSKVANITNSFLQVENVSSSPSTPSYPVWLSTNGLGVFNFTDCIIDSDSTVEEFIANTGQTINFTRTTKLDGVTIPRVSYI